MGSFSRDNRGGGFQSRGRSFGGDRGGSRGGFGGSRGRSSFGGGDRGFDRGPREMFKTTCSNCGKECEVPFRPTNGKPVYCSDCFEKMGGGSRNDSRDSRPERPEFRSASNSFDQNKNFDSLNEKLDRIINLLEKNQPVSTETPKQVKEKQVSEEVKAPKVKKASKK